MWIALRQQATFLECGCNSKTMESLAGTFANGDSSPSPNMRIRRRLSQPRKHHEHSGLPLLTALLVSRRVSRSRLRGLPYGGSPMHPDKVSSGYGKPSAGILTAGPRISPRFDALIQTTRTVAYAHQEAHVYTLWRGFGPEWTHRIPTYPHNTAIRRKLRSVPSSTDAVATRIARTIDIQPNQKPCRKGEHPFP
jgi:hypothetical protein